MRVDETVKRALARVRTRGIGNTAAYSMRVAQELARACLLDLRYGGKPCLSDLEMNRHENQRNDMVHSGYHILRRLFAHVPLSPADVLVDVGCGEGRVINFWLSQGIANPIFGLEGNDAVAAAARKRYRKYPNVTILHGDAVDVLPASGTVFYLYNPFPEETMRRFEAALEGHAATIVYYIDNYLAPFRNGRWTIRDIGFDDGIVEYRASLIRPAVRG